MSESFGEAMQRIQTLPPTSAAELQELKLGLLALPLSLPENRTEDEQETDQPDGVLTIAESFYWPYLMSKPDVEETSPGRWQYSMTPRPAPKSLEQCLNRILTRYGQKLIAQQQRREREQKLRKRQRRAAQRRHNRGQR